MRITPRMCRCISSHRLTLNCSSRSCPTATLSFHSPKAVFLCRCPRLPTFCPPARPLPAFHPRLALLLNLFQSKELRISKSPRLFSCLQLLILFQQMRYLLLAAPPR